MIEPPSRARLIRRLETASKSTSGAPYYPSGRAKERGEVWEKERVEIELAKLITRRHLWLVILLQIMLHIRNFRRAIFCQLIFLLTFVLYYGSGTSYFGIKMLCCFGIGVSKHIVNDVANAVVKSYVNAFPDLYTSVCMGTVAGLACFGAMFAKTYIILTDNWVPLAGKSTRNAKAYANEGNNTNTFATHCLTGLITGPACTDFPLDLPSSREEPLSRPFLPLGVAEVTHFFATHSGVLTSATALLTLTSFTVFPLLSGKPWIPARHYPFPICTFRTSLKDYYPVPIVEALSSRFDHFKTFVLDRHMKLGGAIFEDGHPIFSFDTGLIFFHLFRTSLKNDAMHRKQSFGFIGSKF